jgi:hypothetical protein
MRRVAGRDAWGGERDRRWPGLLLWLPAMVLLGASGLVVMHERVLSVSDTAQAASADSAEVWAFVPGTMASLSATAVQLCAADVALKAAKTPEEQQRWQAQQITLNAAYETTASAYDDRVAETIANGTRRPWEVSPVAPPASVTKDRSCLKLPAVVAAPKSGVGAAVTGASVPYTGEPYTGADRFLTLDQLDAAAAAAGWPMTDGWWPDMRKIIQCETHSLDRYAHNTSDPNGGSYGLAQLNGTQHFIASGEDFNQWMDPVVNLRVALWLRTVRGHFGGSGGWMICSERWGIS